MVFGGLWDQRLAESRYRWIKSSDVSNALVQWSGPVFQAAAKAGFKVSMEGLFYNPAPICFLMKKLKMISSIPNRTLGNFVCCLFLLPLAVSIIGCGGPAGPTAYKVSGSVTYQGSAVVGAVVSLVPESATTPVRSSGAAASPGASGRTDDLGQFSLTTFISGDGALPGSYKVTVSKVNGSQPVGSGAEDDWDNYVPPDGKPSTSVAKNLLPEKYAAPHSTPLTFTVQEGDNRLDITLE